MDAQFSIDQTRYPPTDLVNYESNFVAPFINFMVFHRYKCFFLAMVIARFFYYFLTNIKCVCSIGGHACAR